MENIVTKLLEIFKYLLRDTIIYIFPGLILCLNLYWKNIYNINTLLEKVENKIFLFTIFSYVAGHLIMTLMYFFCEWKIPIEKYMREKTEIDDSQVIAKEMYVLVNSRVIYDEYVERYNILSFFRWNLAGVFLALSILELFDNFSNFSFSWGKIILFILAFIAILKIHYITYKDYVNRVNKAFEITKNKDVF